MGIDIKSIKDLWMLKIFRIELKYLKFVFGRLVFLLEAQTQNDIFWWKINYRKISYFIFE